MKIGNKVKIYQKPLTEEDFEGNATLINKISNNNTDNTETWRVRFETGEEATRTIII